MKRLAALIAVAACGGAPDEDTPLQLVVPFASALSCPQRAIIGPELSVRVEIGGYSSCELEVDDSDLTASGVCGNIVAGTARPLVLIYEQTRAGFGLPRQLAYWLSFVQLCGDVDRIVDVSLDNDGVNDQLYYLQGDVAALPVGASPRSCDFDLETARRWLQSLLAEDFPDFTLDTDSDTTSNLEEACNNTLF
jgi:hypothetical protein